MSNPNGLPITGFQYIIDASGVNNNVNIIVQAQNRIDQNQKKITQGAESFDKAMGANNRSVRVLASEFANLSGAGGQATGIISGLLAAANPLDAALVAVAGGAALAAAGIDAAQKSFEKQQQTIANTARSYEALFAIRAKALATTPEGLATSIPLAVGLFKDATFEEIGKRFGNTFGLAFIEGAKGQLTPARLAQIFIADVQSPADFAQKILANTDQAYKKNIQEQVTLQLVAAASTRTHATALREEINKLTEAGASYDELTPKVYEYLKLINAAGTGVGGSVTGRDITASIGKIRTDLRTRGTSDAKGGLEYLSPFAEKFASQYLDAQNAYQEQSQSAFDDHQGRLADIAKRGAEQQASIQRTYGRALRDISASLAESRTDAATNLAERIADAEANAQERRVQIDAQYADRRASIEENYQERIQSINEDAGSAIFDAVSNSDAFALLRAQQQKARSLRDAERQRQKELADAQKEHDKQAQELQSALDKQKRELQKDFERRIQDLEKAADKQRDKAKESYTDSLADQAQSQKDARDSEADSYAKRQAQLADAFAKRKQAIVDALAAEQDITEEQAKAIIASLKSILNPGQISELLKDLQKAIQAQVTITVTPYKGASTGTGNPSEGPTQYAMGGYTGMGGLAMLHANEWVIPDRAIAGYNRWQEVVSGFLSHASRTVSMAGRGGGGAQTLALDINLNSGLLDAQIAGGTMRTVTRINRATR